MDGFVSGYGLMDRKSGKAITITLWESEEAMQRAEEALRPLRKEFAEALSGSIVDAESYEVSENLVQETHERELVEQELRVARSIQQASLPREVPQLQGWKISPYYRPAREVGGDFYDFHPLPEGRLGVVVGVQRARECQQRLGCLPPAACSSSPHKLWTPHLLVRYLSGLMRHCWLASPSTCS